METLSIKMSVIANDPAAGLGFAVLIDNKTLWSNCCTSSRYDLDLCCELDDGPHVIEFQLRDKTTDHTVLDADNTVIKDAVISIENLVIENHNLDYIVTQNSQYHHNFNGNGDDTVTNFYGTLGCNGSAKFEFESPFYLWLLEHI